METDFPTQEQFDGFLHFLNTLVSSLPKIALLIVLTALSIFLIQQIAILTLRLLDFRRLIGRDMVFLELTPPAFSNKTPQAHQQFFSDLHGFETIRKVKDKLLMHKVAFSAEVVGMREQGIRFIFCVSKENRDSLEQDIASFDADIRVQEVEDYLTKAQRLRARLLEFRLKERYYPLKTQESLEESDPIGYLLGAMANLGPDEVMVLQLVLSPTKVRRAERISNRLLHNKEHLDTLGKSQHKSFGGVLSHGISSALFAVTDTVSDIHHGPSSYSKQSKQTTAYHNSQVAAGIKPARLMGSLETTLAEQVSQKLNGQLFRANIRTLVVMNSSRASNARANDIRKSFNVYKTSYQAVVKRFNLPISMSSRYRSFMFEHRLPGIFNRTGSLLSAAEVSAMYHFPHNEAVRNGDVVKSLSRTLPAPPTIRKRADNNEFDVVLGRNVHLGTATNIGLITEERQKHMYVIGMTGVGKTTLMEYAIIQDIINGKGVAFIDPHGDSAKKILKYIPKERKKDVIYLNPVDIKHPPGLNFLELPAGLEGDDLLLEQGRVTSAVVSVMRKVFSDDDAGAHRIEAIMRNTIRTAFTVEGATLFTLLKLLRNDKFRKEVVSKLEDEDLKDFWQGEIGQAGEMQLVSMTKGVTQRLDRFNSSEPVKRIFGQAKSTINFEDIMNSGKILICNLAHGEIEEDESALFGTTVLAKLKMAAERRARIPENERKPFYVYVDEFQNFATTPFVKMLSSARKYKMFLTIAEQSTKQQEDDRLTEAILSNVGTVVCFRTGSHADEELMLHRFEGFLTKGEISNLSVHNFYIRIRAEESLEPMSGVTVVLPTEEASEAAAKAVIKASQDAYATTYVKPDKSKSNVDKGQSRTNSKAKPSKSERQKDTGKNKSGNDPLGTDDDT